MDVDMHKHRDVFICFLTKLLEPYDCVLCKNSVANFYKTGIIPVAWLDVLFFCVCGTEKFDMACTLMKKTYTTPKTTSNTKLPEISQQIIRTSATESFAAKLCTPSIQTTSKKIVVAPNNGGASTYSLEHIIIQALSKACSIAKHPSGYKIDAKCLQDHVENIFPKHRLVIDVIKKTASLYDTHNRRVFVTKIPQNFSPLPISHVKM